MPKRAAVPGLLAVSTFATTSLPAYSVAISSTIGIIILQGPHHSAQKSTKTGSSDCNTTSSKLESLTIIAIIIILKLIAGIISGSISIISEAIHSLSDFLASVLTFFAVMKSSEPADECHPFGHGKYEDMSGFIEGGLIIFAAFYIIYEACRKLFFGANSEMDTTLGIYVMLFAVVANILVSAYLFHVAKKSNSVSLFADGEHLRTDVYSSLGVMAGLILIKITGIHLLDPIIAICVALFIVKAGYSISKETLNNLLDGSLPAKDLKIIEDNINPNDMTIYDCHNICDEIENLIKQKLEHVTIMIHAEPELI